MKPARIRRFLRVLGEELDLPATAILTGAAAAAFLGRVRPSVDVDMALVPGRRPPGAWARLGAAVDRAVRRTRIAADYAEDIDRWSSISLLDWRRRTRPIGRFGRLSARLLAPEPWSIGKMARYLELDVSDMVGVFRRQKTPAARLSRLWARALRASPPSSAQFAFRRQVEDFLLHHGRSVWGRRFDPSAEIRRFRRAAGIPATPTPGAADGPGRGR